MPRLTPDSLKRSIQAGERGGVYFLYGDESFLKEAAAAQLVEAHLDAATRDFNFDQLRGSDLDPETLASVANTPPMMSAWRVVLVREAHMLVANARTRALLEELLTRQPPEAAIILLAEIPAGSKAQVYERLKKDAKAVEFAALSADDAPGWLIQRAEQHGIELEPAAARAMVSAIGAELGILTREMDKLTAYVAERGVITRADVEAVVGVVPRHNRWEWLDTVGEGRIAEARGALPVLLDSGETGVGLVIALGTQFLRLNLAVAGGKRALEGALPRQQAWLANRLLQQARRWQPEALEGALDDLLRADRLLKSTGLPQQDILEELLLRLEARRQMLQVA